MESRERDDTSPASCNCRMYQKRIDNLQKKYTTLRKNHKKLIGVTVVLTDILEQFVKDDEKNEIFNALQSCSSIYPDLFENTKLQYLTADCGKNRTESEEQIISENEKLYDPATESEKEYYEGFLARPKIPRTPQV